MVIFNSYVKLPEGKYIAFMCIDTHMMFAGPRIWNTYMVGMSRENGIM
jgi:hypothetical protein